MGHRRHFTVLALVALAVAGMSWRRAIAAAPDAPPLVAPPSLAGTGLYRDGMVGTIEPGNRPFSPQYPLWSDGATKRRWIHLPDGSRIDVSDPNEWQFPIGTKVWKEFSFAGRKVETRFIWRAAADAWVTAHESANNYGFSKQAINTYVARQSYPLIARGIRINAICPGPTDTPLARPTPTCG